MSKLDLSDLGYKLLQEERDKRSIELFDKQYDLLSPIEADKVNQYIIDLRYPTWKPLILDDEVTKYMISNIGDVLNKETNRILATRINDSGYKIVKLYHKKLYTLRVHRLVAITFIPNPENKPEVNHINGKKTCNWFGNLEWNTSSENKQHALSHGLYKNQVRGVDVGVNVYDEKTVHNVCKLLSEGKGPKEVSDLLGVPRSLPNSIKYAGKWKHISCKYNIPKAGELPRYDKNKKYPSATLDEEIVHKICKYMEDGKKNKEISELTGISNSAISSIRIGKNWTFISKQYNIKPSTEFFTDAVKYKDKIIECLNNGENDYGKILQKFDLPDNQTNRKYVGGLKFKLTHKSSTTIDQLQ